MSLTHTLLLSCQGNFGPKVPISNEGLALLRFSTQIFSEGSLSSAAPGVGKLDVNLINNTFLDNDYAFDSDATADGAVRNCV